MTYCHTCEKEFHSLGIARHRAMHRDRKENCIITYSDNRYGCGETLTHEYALTNDPGPPKNQNEINNG